MAGLSARSNEDRAAGGWRLCAAVPAAALSASELISLACQVVAETPHPLADMLQQVAGEDPAIHQGASTPSSTPPPLPSSTPLVCARRTINGFEVVLADFADMDGNLSPHVRSEALQVTGRGEVAMILSARRQDSTGPLSCLGLISFAPVVESALPPEHLVSQGRPSPKTAAMVASTSLPTDTVSPMPERPTAVAAELRYRASSNRPRSAAPRDRWRLRYLLIIVLTGIYILASRLEVPRGFVSRVTRLGQTTAWLPPGRYWRWLWPIESATPVNLEEVRMVRLGEANGAAPPGDSAPPTLTFLTTYVDADLATAADVPTSRNAITKIIPVPIRISATVYYAVRDAEAFLAAGNEVDRYIQASSEAILAGQISQHPLDFWMKADRLDLARQCQQQLQERLNHGNCGIRVVGVRINNVEGDDPQGIWLSAYERCQAASSQSRQIIQQGQRERSRLRADTREAVNHLVATAEREHQQMLDEAEAQRAEWEAMAAVSERAALLHALNKALANTQKVLVDPSLKTDINLPPFSTTTATSQPADPLPTTTQPAGGVTVP